MNQIKTLLLTLSFVYAFSSSAELKTGAPLYLEIGEQKILNFPAISKYSVSGNCVHYLRIPAQSQILLKALRPGLATLYVSTSETENETHLIRVEQRRNSPYPPQLLQALNALHSTEVVDGGDHYILRGISLDEKERRAIVTLREHFPTLIADETELGSKQYEKSKKALKALLERHPALNLITEDGALLVRGAVSAPAVKESLSKQIKTIEPSTLIEIQTIKDSDPTLYFKVFLLEVKKELISSLGLEWPAVHPAALNLSTTQFLLSDSIDVTIHALTQRGLVRVLSSPELVVKAPGQAELFAGREIPIHQRNKFNNTLTWKNVGLSLKLDVKEYSGEKVRLTVETEMSHLDTTISNENVPGVQTNRIKTLVDGVIGKPLLLSGLLQEDLHQSSRGIPGLSQIPIIGKLFSSEDYQNSRSELVAVLLPHREAPAHPMQRISPETPRGYSPIPRNYLSIDEKEIAKQDPHYPWNAL
ncbi:MAG: type II and III secretion system protein [Bdellovibrionales bacterium]|nr:type II and III secretion system protein [Oligoflexia bacterium]